MRFSTLATISVAILVFATANVSASRSRRLSRRADSVDAADNAAGGAVNVKPDDGSLGGPDGIGSLGDLGRVDGQGHVDDYGLIAGFGSVQDLLDSARRAGEVSGGSGANPGEDIGPLNELIESFASL